MAGCMVCIRLFASNKCFIYELMLANARVYGIIIGLKYKFSSLEMVETSMSLHIVHEFVVLMVV